MGGLFIISKEELESNDTRLVLRIKPSLAPIKANILPLMKKSHAEKARNIYNELKSCFMVVYEDTGNIGKRYRRGDAIGIPYAVTVDDITLDDNTVTVRERDSMKQIRISADQLKNYLWSKM